MTRTPLPGRPVRGSRSGGPLMALFDLLGRRWAMGALWRLCEEGPATFRALRSRCGDVSPSVLNSRLKELREAGLVRRAEFGYEATAAGLELYAIMQPMRRWSEHWAEALSASGPKPR